MSKLLSIICLFLLYFSCETSTQDEEDESIDFEHYEMNEGIDQLLEKFKVENSGDIRLEDRNTTAWQVKIPFTNIIVLKKTLSFFHGRISGLDTIRRIGDAKYAILKFPCTSLDSIFSLGKLKFTFDFREYYGNVRIFGGRVRGEIGEVIVNVGLKINVTQPAPHLIELTSIALKSTKSVRVRIENSIFIDWLTNSLIKNTVVELVEKKFTEALGQKYNIRNLKLVEV